MQITFENNDVDDSWFYLLPQDWVSEYVVRAIGSIDVRYWRGAAAEWCPAHTLRAIEVEFSSQLRWKLRAGSPQEIHAHLNKESQAAKMACFRLLHKVRQHVIGLYSGLRMPTADFYRPGV